MSAATYLLIWVSLYDQKTVFFQKIVTFFKKLKLIRGKTLTLVPRTGRINFFPLQRAKSHIPSPAEPWCFELFRRCYLNFIKRKEQCLNINTGLAQSFSKVHILHLKHTLPHGFPKSACSEIHSTWNHIFPLLSEQPSFVVTDWINLKPPLIHMAWTKMLKVFLMRIDVVMLHGWKKAREKKPPVTGFLRPLRISSIPKLFLKVFLPASWAIFGLLFCLSVWRAVIGWSRGWSNCSSSWAACGYRFADVRQQVWITGQLLDIYPILFSIGQATSDKCLQTSPKGRIRFRRWKGLEKSSL